MNITIAKGGLFEGSLEEPIDEDSPTSRIQKATPEQELRDGKLDLRGREPDSLHSPRHHDEQRGDVPF